MKPPVPYLRMPAEDTYQSSFCSLGVHCLMLLLRLAVFLAHDIFSKGLPCNSSEPRYFQRVLLAWASPCSAYITESLLRNDSCYLVQPQQTLLWFYLPCSDTSTFPLWITITVLHTFIGPMRTRYITPEVEGQVVKSHSIKLSCNAMRISTKNVSAMRISTKIPFPKENRD